MAKENQTSSSPSTATRIARTNRGASMGLLNLLKYCVERKFLDAMNLVIPWTEHVP
ncbi:hypothetical protein JI739_17190 [Ramlibacter sp. AW1]|uniref:Uncharacterized protein n=1 Tax=Ramlibacter aurantiacus TaxID=2801330 RepID=A0A936ZRE1_9BURK|nr:hypothetical protein [Ramlibacter aurantiacus]MBL0422088.1 hypothetical protein [Ramlibacter aurantiacus]